MNVNIKLLNELVEKGYLTVRSHPTADLLIYNYTALAQYERYWTPETLLCRGLITTSSGKVVARSFPKFFNLEEHQQPLPLEPFKVTTKMDGSLAILYFVDDTPFIATRGSFISDQAVRANMILQRRYKSFPFEKQYTYLFEVIYPENRIVVNYGMMEDLVLLAVVETATGNELDIHQYSWPFPVVRQYDGITDLEALRKIEEANAEGFVVRFESGLRIKMKFAEYVRLHRVMTHVTARHIWELLRDDKPFDELLTKVPDEFYAWVSKTRAELEAQFAAIEAECRQVYNQVRDLPGRKEQAAIVLRTRYAAPVFRMLDGRDYRDLIWKQLRPSADAPFRSEDES